MALFGIIQWVCKTTPLRHWVVGLREKPTDPNLQQPQVRVLECFTNIEIFCGNSEWKRAPPLRPMLPFLLQFGQDFVLHVPHATYRYHCQFSHGHVVSKTHWQTIHGHGTTHNMFSDTTKQGLFLSVENCVFDGCQPEQTLNHCICFQRQILCYSVGVCRSGIDFPKFCFAKWVVIRVKMVAMVGRQSLELFLCFPRQPQVWFSTTYVEDVSRQWRRRSCVGPDHSNANLASVRAFEFEGVRNIDP